MSPDPAELTHAITALTEAMHRVRRECAWNASMTHSGLRRYLLEETYELLDALDRGDAADMREELGDVLLQVVFHAEIATESAEAGFSLADVVSDVTAKMIHRHPHVFATETAADIETVLRVWGAAKAEEKSTRNALFDGIPIELPALARAQKYASRLERSGKAVESHVAVAEYDSEAELGAALYAIACAAEAQGLDAEGALRGYLGGLAQETAASEA